MENLQTVTADNYQGRMIQGAQFFFCPSSHKGIFDPVKLLLEAGFQVELIEDEDLICEEFKKNSIDGGKKAVVVIGSTNSVREIALRREGAKLGISTVSIEISHFYSDTLHKRMMDWVALELESESKRISFKPAADRLLSLSIYTDEWSGHREIKVTRQVSNDVIIDLEDMVWSFLEESAKRIFYHKVNPIYLLGSASQLNAKSEYLKNQPQTIAIFDSGNLYHLQNLANYCYRLGIPVQPDYE